jgi:transcription antitermination factor NusG
VLKPSDNPPLLPPGVATLADLKGPWWIAHTKSRFEKAFAFDLLRRGIGYFLPMAERTKVSGGKKRRVMLPLFPSYVFFCGSAEERYEALATDRLCRVIDVIDQAGLLRDLLSLQDALARKAVLDPYPFTAVGRHCRVTAGPFQGLEGVLVQKLGPTRLVLQVNMLGQGAAMEIDAGLLEPIGADSPAEGIPAYGR